MPKAVGFAVIKRYTVSKCLHSLQFPAAKRRERSVPSFPFLLLHFLSFQALFSPLLYPFISFSTSPSLYLLFYLCLLQKFCGRPCRAWSTYQSQACVLCPEGRSHLGQMQKAQARNARMWFSKTNSVSVHSVCVYIYI